MFTEKKIISIISKSLKAKINIDSNINNTENWDSIGHLEILSSLDKFSKGKYGFLSLFIFLSPFCLPDLLLPMLRFFHGLGASLILVWIYHNQNSRVVNFLEWRPIKYIGVISYGLYIWQGFFVRTGPAIEPKIWLHELPYNIPLTFIVAIISYEFYEKKILKYKNRYTVTNKV